MFARLAAPLGNTRSLPVVGRVVSLQFPASDQRLLTAPLQVLGRHDHAILESLQAKPTTTGGSSIHDDERRNGPYSRDSVENRKTP